MGLPRLRLRRSPTEPPLKCVHFRFDRLVVSFPAARRNFDSHRVNFAPFRVLSPTHGGTPSPPPRCVLFSAFSVFCAFWACVMGATPSRHSGRRLPAKLEQLHCVPGPSRRGCVEHRLERLRRSRAGAPAHLFIERRRVCPPLESTTGLPYLLRGHFPRISCATLCFSAPRIPLFLDTL